MKSQYCFWFIIWTTTMTIVVSASSSSSSTTSRRYRVEGCSLVGIELQNCLVPDPKTIDSCCTALNQALLSGYYCLCSLLTLSNNYPIIADEIALSFSNCYLSLPPDLTHCHVQPPRNIVTAPPVDALPWINHHLPPPLLPVLVPPELPRPFVPHLPPKVNANPSSTLNNLNSSIVYSSSSVPSTSNEYERSDHVTSDGADVVMLLQYSRNLMMAITVVLACISA